MTTRTTAVVRLVVACALVATVGGCTGEEDPVTLPTTSPSATPSTDEEPSPAPSPSPSDPFAVPDEITADYVERVLNEINRLDAELTRDILRRPLDEDATELPPEDQAHLEAIYAEPLLTFNGRAKVDLLRNQDQRDDLLPPDQLGHLVMAVEELLGASPCLVARVNRDWSEVDAVADADQSSLAFTVLQGAANANLTSWRLSNLIIGDASPGSPDEAELRELRLEDLAGQLPEACL